MNAIAACDGGVRLSPWPAPVPGPSEVLIRVRAAGINPCDLALARSELGAPLRITGQDLAGTVAQAGALVSYLKTGDPVCAMTSAARLGAHAELVAVPAYAVARLPVGLAFTDAASLPVSALTAWQALFNLGQLEAGQRVLIHGAAGGVGCVAVQLALWKGAEVFGTTSAAHLAYVESLGTHLSLDHAAQRFEAVVPEVELVLDTLGGEFLRRSYAVLKPGGIILSVAEPPDPAALAAYQVRGSYCQPQPDGFTLALLLELVASGKLCTTIAGTFPLAQAAAAWALASAPQVQGKVVLLID